MATAQNKTQPTGVTAEEFLALVQPEQRRQDGLVLLDRFNHLTGLKPQMWGPSIIGYGRYHYKYESGREGDFLMTGFSPRKAALTVYVMPGYGDMAEKLSRLGKHKIGKSCLYITRLGNIDMDVLDEIVMDGLTYMRTHYETSDA